MSDVAHPHGRHPDRQDSEPAPKRGPVRQALALDPSGQNIGLMHEPVTTTLPVLDPTGGMPRP